MNLFKNIKNIITPKKSIYGVKLMQQNTYANTFSYNGQIYRSDIVRSCIRPFANAVSKLYAKHIRITGSSILTYPEPYIKALLEQPNPYMHGQMLLYRLAIQTKLNSNAFALIYRDENGYPCQIYPIPAQSADAKYDEYGYLWIEFLVKNGNKFIFPYRDLIHLRQDYNENDIFGDSPAQTLSDLMEIVATTDCGIKGAIKNGGILRWLLKFNQVIKPEQLKKEAQRFASAFLTISDNSDDNNIVGAIDNRATLEQLKTDDYIPNATQMDRTTNRLYNFFGTNEKIIQSKYTEDEWNAYSKSEIEPFALQLQNEFTSKLFTPRERSCGNKIVFEEASLQCASISTKLNLREMVDSGAMTPNEWRAAFNMPPLEGGDKPLRRKDTGYAQEGKEEDKQ